MSTPSPAPSTGMSALDAALARCEAAGREAGRAARTACAHKAEQFAAGLRPRHGIWNEPLPLDDEFAQRQRARIEEELRAASWETPRGEVIEAQIKGAA